MFDNNRDKHAVVIQRLSSRLINEQTKSSMTGNFCSPTPLCIDKSFYECKNNVGQVCCVQVYGDCFDSTSPIAENLNSDPAQQQQLVLSKMFDNKRKYVGYVATSVLQQVANHVSVESLHKLCCCLPKSIEDILINVPDIDCDRLIRILVTEVIQCYGSTVNQLTDWYAFANLVKPLYSSSFQKRNDIDDKQSNNIENKMPLKSVKTKSDPHRVIKKRMEQIPAFTSPSPSVDHGSSPKSTPGTAYNSPPTDRTPSLAITPQISPTPNRTTPSSAQSNLELTKETTVPTGAGYRSRRRQKNDRVLILRKNSIDLANQTQLQKQKHVRIAKRDEHYSQLTKGNDSSLNSDVGLTTHHEGRDHNQHSETVSTSSDTKIFDRHYQKTSRFDMPSAEIDGISVHSSRLSSSHSAATEKAFQKNSITHSKMNTFVTTKSTVSNELEHVDRPNLSEIECPLILKLLTLSDSFKHITHHPQQSFHRLPSDTSSVVFNEAKQQAQLVSKTKHSINLNDNQKSFLLEKKHLSINHYPNMLTDFE